MAITENEENILLDYLFQPEIQPKLLKRNKLRQKTFEDAAEHLSKRSGQKQQLSAEDVSNICQHINRTRSIDRDLNLAQFFKYGRKNIKSRRAFRVEGAIGSLDLESPRKSVELLERSRVSSSEPFVGRRTRQTPSKSPKHKIASDRLIRTTNTFRIEIPARQVVGNSKSASPSLFQILQLDEQYKTQLFRSFPISGDGILSRFEILEGLIREAVDQLPNGLVSSVSIESVRFHRPEDSELLKPAEAVNPVSGRQKITNFHVCRSIIGMAVHKWVFELVEEFPNVAGFQDDFREAVKEVWSEKRKALYQGTRGLDEIFDPILNDSLRWRASQPTFQDLSLKTRAQEYGWRLRSLISMLLQIPVPTCPVKHEVKHKKLQNCNLWTCRLEGVFYYALDLCVRMRARERETLFQWPQRGESFDKNTMVNTADTGSNEESELKVILTYLPTVLDRGDWERGGRGVWSKAFVHAE